MRISDWSSDVCSSDLLGFSTDVFGSTITRLPTLPRLAVQRIFFQSALVLFAGRGSGGFGFGELGRFRGILFAARRFFLLAVCLRSSGFALGELTHSLFGHALFFGKAQRFRIRPRNRRRSPDRLVQLHEGSRLSPNGSSAFR